MFDEALIIRTNWVNSANTGAVDALRFGANFDREFVESVRVQTGIERTINKPFCSTKELLDFAESVVSEKNVVPNDVRIYLGNVRVLSKYAGVMDCSIQIKCRKYGSVEVRAHSLEPIDGNWFVCLLFKGTVDQMLETLNAAKENPVFSECLGI